MIAGLLNKLTGRDLFGRGEKKGASRKDTLIFETDTPHQETHASYRLDKPLKGSFRFPVDGLDKIKFFTVKHGANTEGMRLIIKDGQDSSVLRKVALKGKKVKNNDYSTFRFKAIKDSADREFEFLLEGLGEPYPCVMHNSEVSFPGINLVPSGSVNLRIYAKTEMLGGYQSWIKMKEPSKRELEEQRRARFAYEPKISVIAPAFNAPQGARLSAEPRVDAGAPQGVDAGAPLGVDAGAPLGVDAGAPLGVDAGAHGQFLADMVESVLKQTYSNWELVIAARGDGDLKDMLVDYSKKDSRIKVKFLDTHKGIAGNLNEALTLATGDFATMLDPRDTLSPFALFEVVKAVNENPLADFIYSDEDKISEDGKERSEPFFKPDFSPDTLRSYNYIGRFSVIKKTLLDEVGGFRTGYDGSEDYDLILRATEKAKGIAHMPKILYHRRREGAWNGDIAAESAKRALSGHLKRIGLDGSVEEGLSPGFYRTIHKTGNNPKVSIIIPTRDHADFLKRCVESIVDKSIYKNFEIIIVENGSLEKDTFELYDKLAKIENVKVIEWKGPFNFSAINNFAADFAAGEVLLFLNNDTEVISSDWLESMLEHAGRPEVGAVGAKLYYPDNTVQHSGVIVYGGGADHFHRDSPKDSSGYFGRLIITQNLSAVTAACLMVRKEVFREVGGFDEGYPVAFGDVDLCLKIRDKGYLVVFTPYAELYHHESKTRGSEDTPEKKQRAKREMELLRKRWRHIFRKGDPYHNPNLTLDFSLNFRI